MKCHDENCEEVHDQKLEHACRVCLKKCEHVEKNWREHQEKSGHKCEVFHMSTTMEKLPTILSVIRIKKSILVAVTSRWIKPTVRALMQNEKSKLVWEIAEEIGALFKEYIKDIHPAIFTSGPIRLSHYPNTSNSNCDTFYACGTYQEFHTNEKAEWKEVYEYYQVQKGQTLPEIDMGEINPYINFQ